MIRDIIKIGKEMINFQDTIHFVDTGIRRWPEPGEYYVWLNEKTGEYLGPMMCEEQPDEWMEPKEYFAIYKKVD